MMLMELQKYARCVLFIKVRESVSPLAVAINKVRFVTMMLVQIRITHYQAQHQPFASLIRIFNVVFTLW